MLVIAVGQFSINKYYYFNKNQMHDALNVCCDMLALRLQDVEKVRLNHPDKIPVSLTFTFSTPSFSFHLCIQKQLLFGVYGIALMG